MFASSRGVLRENVGCLHCMTRFARGQMLLGSISGLLGLLVAKNSGLWVCYILEKSATLLVSPSV